MDVKSKKRKLDDALRHLDEAIKPLSSDPPAKKPRLTSSIYSTLAKYGITSRPRVVEQPSDANLSKLTPRLSAIITRRASRSQRNKPKLSKSSPHSSSSEYSPSSIQSFLARLSTFKLSTFSSSLAGIDAVAASRCGWVNEGKDRLHCRFCGASWVIAGRDGMTRDAANALIEKQRSNLVDMHKDGCPWKKRQCDASIYHAPLGPPTVMAKEIKDRAVQLNSLLGGIEIKHPMTATQVRSLLATLADIPNSSANVDTEMLEAGPSSLQSTPSEAATLIALFGWSISQTQLRFPQRAASHDRASPATPDTFHNRPEITTSDQSNSVGNLINGSSAGFSRHSSSTPSEPQQRGLDSTLLQCYLCQRRIGLWAFSGSNSAAPKRQFDLLKEHRSYCPYVVRSTVVPSLPTASAQFPTTRSSHGRNGDLINYVPFPTVSITQFNCNNSTVEGWRAVLSVVSRAWLGRKQMQRSLSARRVPQVPGDETAWLSDCPQDTNPALDSIEVMVNGVKNHGGRDLLKYVRGLLGS